MVTLKEAHEEIKNKTISNRDQMMEMLDKYDNKTIITWLIDTMKYYSQDEDILTGQYMMVLDAVHKILTKREMIDTGNNTWTLEEFLNDIPYHSDIVNKE